MWLPSRRQDWRCLGQKGVCQWLGRIDQELAPRVWLWVGMRLSTFSRYIHEAVWLCGAMVDKFIDVLRA